MLEMDRYQMRYHRYVSNVRESSKLSLHFYFALRKLFHTAPTVPHYSVRNSRS